MPHHHPNFPRKESFFEALAKACDLVFSGKFAEGAVAFGRLGKRNWKMTLLSMVGLGSALVGTVYAQKGTQNWSFLISGGGRDGMFDAFVIDPDATMEVARGVHTKWGERRVDGEFRQPFLEWLKRRRSRARVIVTQDLDNNRVAMGVYSVGHHGEAPVDIQFPANLAGFVHGECVHFEFDRSRVQSDDVALASVATLMKSRRDLAVLVEGNADLRGSTSYNEDLGEQRARSVAEELVRLGVSPSRIYPVTFGKTKIKAPGDSERAHMENRRVDFVLVPWAPLQ